MLERIQLPFPMWRVHYQLAGGNRRSLPAALVIAALVALAILTFRKLESKTPLSELCAGALTTLIVVQCFLLLLGCCNSVHRVLLKDYESRMIESHRLTPMSNIGVVLGYLFGPVIQLLVIAATIVVCGLALCITGDIQPGPWLVGNLLAFFAAVPLWAMVVVMGMRLGKPISPLPFLFAAGAFGVPLFMLPGVALALGLYSTTMAIAVVSGNAPLHGGAIALLAGVHMVFAAYWVVIAATKYRRPELPAINGWRGLALVALWSLAAFGGMVAYHSVMKRNMRSLYEEDVLSVQWVITLMMTIPIIAMACAATAEYALLVRRGCQPRGWTDRFPDLSGAAFLALSAVGIACMFTSPTLAQRLVAELQGESSPEFATNFDPTRSWAYTAAAFLCAALAARAMFLLCLPRRGTKPRRAGLRSIGYLSVFWIVPPAFDEARVAMTEGASYVGFMWGLSPFGVISSAWLSPELRIVSGLVVQALFVFVLTLIASRTE